MYQNDHDILDISDIVNDYWIQNRSILSRYQVKLTSTFIITSGIPYII